MAFNSLCEIHVLSVFLAVCRPSRLSILYVRFKLWVAAAYCSCWSLSILYVRFPLEYWVSCSTTLSFNSLCEIHYCSWLCSCYVCDFQFSMWDSGLYLIGPKGVYRVVVENFQFSMWDSDIRTSTIYHHTLLLSILYVRFLMVYLGANCKLCGLSILYVRFPTNPKVSALRSFVFQFSMWDSQTYCWGMWSGGGDFQFSMWDSNMVG